MDLAIYFENIVRDFSRYNKYTLGAEMRTKSRDIVKLIIKANSTKDRLPVLLESGKSKKSKIPELKAHRNHCQTRVETVMIQECYPKPNKELLSMNIRRSP